MTAFSIGSCSFHGLFKSGKMSLFGYLESIKDTLNEEGLTVAKLSVDGANVWHDGPAIREQN